ncbi:MAG TPA: protein kinase [Thermoanaerobaculia bacterium]|nr:protein kinase [Thermoanaerobaculia bacterium]
MTLSAGSRLGPYEILGPLGAGGMGAVFRARDARLDRDVAIKVLSDDLAGDAEALHRFRHEAKVVAALSHPNILSIFDIGSEKDVSYAVTELLEGQTLREKLRAGPLPPDVAMDCALQLVRGLAAAHEKGIVHRDLKPENLFLTKDGLLKILDFGLAKRTWVPHETRDADQPTTRLVTAPGVVVGTLAYMSPEQVESEPVDPRSDVFSVGAVLYEMFSGRMAFRRETVSATMVAILREEPPDLSGAGARIPPGLDGVIRRCLKKKRESRYASAADLVSALQEIAGGTGATVRRPGPGLSRRPGALLLAGIAAVVLLGVVTIFLSRRTWHSTPTGGEPRRVAVLPFENLGAPGDDYFADGITDEIRGKLTALKGLEVIARSSSTPYRKTQKSLPEIGRELGVRYLLTATVRWEKGGGTSRVKVSPELVEISGPGAPALRWQQPFDAELTDVFRVQSDIASRVARSLGVALGAGDEKRLSEKPTDRLDAWEAFLHGEEVSKALGVGDPPTLRKAVAFYEDAVALDPSFAAAWARLARAGVLLYNNTAPSPDLARRSLEAAERAVKLAPDRGDGYGALGAYQLAVANDYERALAYYVEGQKRSPGDAELLSAAASAEMRLGRWTAALEHLREADRLDPRSVANKRRLGFVLLYLRRPGEAREACDRGLALAPGNLALVQWKAMTYLSEGSPAGARGVVDAASAGVEATALVAYFATFQDLVWILSKEQQDLLLRLTPAAFDGNRGTWGVHLAQASAFRGDASRTRAFAEEARRAYEEQLRATPEDAQQHALLGVALAYLGRKSDAVKEGERGVALLPISKNAYAGPYMQHQLVRIHLLTGEPEKALDRLEPLLRIPYYLSPGWLRADPTFGALRGNPRFEKLAKGGA